MTENYLALPDRHCFFRRSVPKTELFDTAERGHSD